MGEKGSAPMLALPKTLTVSLSREGTSYDMLHSYLSQSPYCDMLMLLDDVHRSSP